MPTTDTLERVVQSRLGGRVERCHVVPHSGSYSNATHQWGVAMLMLILWPEDFPRLAAACLTHDVPEHWVGDIPATSLRSIPGLRDAVREVEGAISEYLDLPREDSLSVEDHAKLKACDRLELYLWAQEQAFMGNQYARICQTNMDIMFETNPLPDPADKLLMDIRLRYGTTRQEINVLGVALANVSR